MVLTKRTEYAVPSPKAYDAWCNFQVRGWLTLRRASPILTLFLRRNKPVVAVAALIHNAGIPGLGVIEDKELMT